MQGLTTELKNYRVMFKDPEDKPIRLTFTQAEKVKSLWAQRKNPIEIGEKAFCYTDIKRIEQLTNEELNSYSGKFVFMFTDYLIKRIEDFFIYKYQRIKRYTTKNRPPDEILQTLYGYHKKNENGVVKCLAYHDEDCQEYKGTYSDWQDCFC